jgi:hypothetical protein
MQAARVTVALLAMLAASGAVALAQSEGGKAADPARQRAEDLARAASQRFGEVIKEERVAQAQGKPPAAPSPGSAAGDDPWTATLRWLEYSDREYRSIMRKLTQGGGVAPAPAPPAPAPAAKPTPPPAAVASKPAPSEQSEDWLTRSSQRFQSIMRKLTEGAAPPPKGEPVAEPKSTPAKEGYSMPAEWERHEATWISWPATCSRRCRRCSRSSSTSDRAA